MPKRALQVWYKGWHNLALSDMVLSGLKCPFCVGCLYLKGKTYRGCSLWGTEHPNIPVNLFSVMA